MLNPVLVLDVEYADEDTNGVLIILSKNARSVSERLKA